MKLTRTGPAAAHLQRCFHLLLKATLYELGKLQSEQSNLTKVIKQMTNLGLRA